VYNETNCLWGSLPPNFLEVDMKKEEENLDVEAVETARERRNRRYGEAAAHIIKTIPQSDIGGIMVMAAFHQDAIDRED